MYFNRVKNITAMIALACFFMQFQCDERSESKLTIVNVTVRDVLTNEPVEGAVIGIYGQSGDCIKDTIVTDEFGVSQYAFFNTYGAYNVEAYSARTIPGKINESSIEWISIGKENEITFQTNYLSQAFLITVVNQYDSLFLKSKDGYINSPLYDYWECEGAFEFSRFNDQAKLYENEPNISFSFAGVIDSINYIFIEKYLAGTETIDTLQVTPEYEYFPVVIE